MPEKEHKKIIGKLEQKNQGDYNGSQYTDLKIGTTRIRVWHAIRTASGDIQNSVLPQLEGVKPGDIVEADYALVEKNGKTYNNLASIAIRTDNPPPSSSTETARPRSGKPIEEDAKIILEVAGKTAHEYVARRLEKTEINFLSQDEILKSELKIVYAVADELLEYILTRLPDVVAKLR